LIAEQNSLEEWSRFRLFMNKEWLRLYGEYKFQTPIHADSQTPAVSVAGENTGVDPRGWGS